MSSYIPSDSTSATPGLSAAAPFADVLCTQSEDAPLPHSTKALEAARPPVAHWVMFYASSTSHLATLGSVLFNPSGLRALCFTGIVIMFLDLGYCRAVLLFRNQFLLWEEGIICSCGPSLEVEHADGDCLALGLNICQLWTFLGS
jgi:hypothetical protein